ncbi:putative protein N(5)-glutamine methyltransferase [Saccharothrix syringae]|uniref:peptide chain release factor N(5)-glutamine methyltransferase n=1 Tax=Saccharothrix syringae TaxID=103733 RepID=A0A5Q0HEQ3_SACSY|nr:putative protein N(5)-glutamine methyltransferase [Saccharothrix syringae]
MKYRAPVLQPQIVTRLRAAGCVFAEDEAALLLEAARTPAELEDMTARRVAGLPLEQVLGWAEFCGLRIAVEPGVFVPRQRTRHMVDLAVDRLRAGAVVLDMCCGTGAVAAAIAHRVPGIEVHAADVEPAAVRCARRNLPGGHVYQGDLYAPLPGELRGRVDVLVANAPYVPSDEIALMPPEARDHEPRVALDGGTDGVDVQRRVVAGAGEWLAPGGRLLIETGARQAATTAAAFAAAGLRVEVAAREELAATVVIGTRSGTPATPAG